MPEGDYAAAQRLAVVSIEPPNAFINPTVAVQAAVLDRIGHLLPKVVPSSVGAMYLRFALVADHDEALAMQPFPHEGARIDLFAEEEFNRIEPRLDACVVLADTGFPAEFINPRGIDAMFSSFGKVLEIDPLVLAGSELAIVRVVVLLKNPRDVPCDVWPLGRTLGCLHCLCAPHPGMGSRRVLR